MDGVSIKLETFQNDGSALASQVPAEKQNLDVILTEVNDMLQLLLSNMAARQRKLEQSLELQQFLSEYKNVR